MLFDGCDQFLLIDLLEDVTVTLHTKRQEPKHLALAGCAVGLVVGERDGLVLRVDVHAYRVARAARHHFAIKVLRPAR